MTIRSPHPDVAIPDALLPDFVLESARASPPRGGKAAIVDAAGGITFTEHELWRMTRQLATGLVALGMKAGDVACICLPNSPAFAVAFHGALAGGATVTTLSPLATVPEMVFQLEDSGARFLLVAATQGVKAAAAARQSHVEQVLVVGGKGSDFFASLPACPSDGADDVPPSGAGPSGPSERETQGLESVAVLPYSSGTTGLPKGVMLTHRNLVANLCQMHPIEGVSADDTLIAVLPFFHIYGMQVVMNLGLRAGATIVTLPRFDLGAFLSAVQEHHVTRAFVVPPIVMALAHHPVVDEYDLSSLERVVSAAAPLGAELASACAGRLGCPVVQGYGLTEAGPATHAVPAGACYHPGSVGDLLPGTEGKLVDSRTGTEVAEGQTGELWVRGPQVMLGYHHDAAATSATLDDQGWLHTGDLFRTAPDGRFYVRDRVKELIKYKGYQVAPAELEAVLLSHPAVSDAAVVPIPDEEAGEVPKAFVVLDTPIPSPDLVAYVAARVAPHKRVRALEVIPAIPRSPAGKTLRRVLIDRERATRD